MFQTYPDHERAPVSRLCLTGTWSRYEEKLLSLNDLGQCVTVQLNRAGSRIRSEDKNAKAVTVLFLDFDGLQDEPKLVGRFAPTMTVVSGGGWHAYFAIDPVHKRADLERWQDIQKGLALFAGADPVCSSVGQVARLAGTYHMKNPRRPFLVEVVSYDPGRIFTLDDFRAYAFDRRKHDQDQEIAALLDGRRSIGFPLRRAALRDAIEKVSRAQVGFRRNTLLSQAYRLGCFHAFSDGTWQEVSLSACMSVARKWTDNSRNDMYRAFMDGYTCGAFHGKDNPPHAPQDFRRWKQDDFLATLCVSSIGPIAVLEGIGTPEQRGLFDSSKHASTRIACRLKELGYVRGGKARIRGRVAQTYVLAGPEQAFRGEHGKTA